jgi:intracellular septation protein
VIPLLQRTHIKTFCDIAPGAAFFIIYALRIDATWQGVAYEPLFVATAAMVVMACVSLAISGIFLRTLAKLPLIMVIPAVVFGALTLWFHNETFIKIKPTIMNLLFAAFLLGSVWFKKPAVKLLMGDSLPFSAADARTLTIRWGLFFVGMACMNEIMRHGFSTDAWVWWKTWGGFLCGVPFMILQWPLLQRTVAAAEASKNPSV